MTYVLSEPIESLLDGRQPERDFEGPDLLIVGSGYGAAVAAMRLAGVGREVWVFERGREYLPGEFPQDIGAMPGHVRVQPSSGARTIGYDDALFDLRLGDGVDVLVGSGLGGTSLINANVAARPDPDLFSRNGWPRAFHAGTELDTAFAEIERLLDVAEVPGKPARLAALERLGKGLFGRRPRAPDFVGKAPLAVRFGASGGGAPAANAVGVMQPACTLCGNCVSGCNTGAKGALNLNLLPLAKARGARLFTGATVLSVVPVEGGTAGWRVRFRRTLADRSGSSFEVFHVPAKQVILAAGALGSTEILMRSRERGDLKLSERLGERFSNNGDGIAFSFAQHQVVDAVGDPSQHAPTLRPGPTISGMIRTRARDPRSGQQVTVTIEDGGVPAMLGELFGEVVTTGAQAQRLGSEDGPKWLAEREAADAKTDPLAAQPETLKRCQSLLLMGDDGAAGTLRLAASDGQPDWDGARISVAWTDARGRVAANPALEASHALLSRHSLASALGGGQYVPNPFWRPLPDDAGALAAALPGGRMVSVHPLGGCGMGDDVRTGVVDHGGELFRNEAGTPDRYTGLFVMDGAILPGAIGVNPFLTIAALAWRASGLLLARNNWNESATSTVDSALSSALLAASGPPPARKAEAVGLTLNELMRGRLEAVPDWLRGILPPAAAERLAGEQGMILDLRMPIPDLDEWLQAPGTTKIEGGVRLHANPLPVDAVRHSRPGRGVRAHLGKALLEGSCRVTLLRLDRPIDRFPDDYGDVTYTGPNTVSARSGEAVRAYLARRGGPGSAASVGNSGAIDAGKAFFAVSSQHADYRLMEYSFAFALGGGAELTISGRKRIAWRRDNPRLANALVDLPITLRHSAHRQTAKGLVSADLLDMTGEGAPRIEGGANLPAALQGVARLGLFFTRTLLHSALWEFGAPDYPEAPKDGTPAPQPAPPGPIRVADGRLVEPDEIELAVPLSATDATELGLKLTRYPRPPGEPAEPVLLIHGLAQGSLIYSTHSLDENMAEAMWRAGFDVWLLDYRLSNRVLPFIAKRTVPAGAIPPHEWSMEELGRIDIPAAVNFVFETTGQPVKVFAHCVGATAMTMALLGGENGLPWLDHRRLAALAINAIHPWIRFSPENRLRARFASVLSQRIGDELLDPIPAPDPSAAVQLFDRLAHMIARFRESREDEEPHRGDRDEIERAICDRMTLTYGRMWRHANLDPRTHVDFARMLGPSPAAVYRHLYYFARRERVSDWEGENVFLTEERIRSRWRVPTVFFHGAESEVFNSVSACWSAARMNRVLNPPLSAPRYPVLGHPEGARTMRVPEGWPAPMAAAGAAAGNAVPVTHFTEPGYGHMDVVFARDASRRIYPRLVDFFRHPAQFVKDVESDPAHLGADKCDPHGNAPSAPSVGPILRAAWVDQGKVWLRYWMELLPYVTSEVRDVSIADVENQGPLRRDPGLPGVAWIDVELKADGRLPSDFRPLYRGRDPLPLLPRPPLPAPQWLPALREQRAEAHFLAASCRYPGTPLDAHRGDAPFAGMLAHVEAKDAVGAVFMLGDQIYADATAQIIDAEGWRERYVERYREAFGSKYFKRLARRVPLHFAVDDHEFDDAWSGQPGTRFEQACVAARCFQGAYRDATPLHLDAAASAGAGPLWYPLACPQEFAFPAFLMDTRSERELRSHAVVAPHMISGAQRSALERWLLDARDTHGSRPKFIFCGVVVAPVQRDFVLHEALWRREDGWAGYPETLGWLAKLIVDENIHNVVFVGGDLHFSAVARLELSADGTNPVTAWQLVSSALYAPLPFANADPAAYDWGRASRLPLPGQAAQIDYRAELLATASSQFMRVDLTQAGGGWALDVRICGPDGAALPLPALTPPNWLTPNGEGWRIMLP